MSKAIFAFLGLLVMCFAPLLVKGQEMPARTIRWNSVYSTRFDDGSEEKYFNFDSMAVDPAHKLPVYLEKISCAGNTEMAGFIIDSIEYQPLTDVESSVILNSGEALDDSVQYNFHLTGSGNDKFLILSLLPFRKNSLTGEFEKVIRFTLAPGNLVSGTKSLVASSHDYAAHSVLAQGKWIKLGFTQGGVCKLTYNDVQSFGFDMAALDPRTIKIFGNGSGMLPESNQVSRYDDLAENSILVQGEPDAKFDAGDYILFYVSPQIKWKYNTSQGVWEHVTNIYSDTTFVFLTAGSGVGKRITGISSTALDATVEVNTFEDYALHETDQVNLIGSGRRWFGEIFDLTTQYSFNFNFPGIVNSSEVSVRVVAAARSTISSSFTITAGGQSWPVSASPISTYYNSAFASGANSFQKVPASGESQVVSVTYNKPLSSSKGWLDYVELNAQRSLNFTQGQMAFRNSGASGAGQVAQYQLGNASSSVSVWDVTNPVKVRSVITELAGSVLKFRLPADTIREFMAFDGTSFISPASSKNVVNQDLHALQTPDLLIIAPPVFMEQAVRLAAMHNQDDDLSTTIVTPETIYNEFSSGSQDVSAIRDFLKMFYDRKSTEGKLPYLLLFGDGSYDYKDFHKENTNFVNTFQSPESFDPVHSYTYDDYFGFLDDNEGTGSFDMVDIGIGRLPVKSVDEATALVDKILFYAGKNSAVQGDWRNTITFVADDEDDNEHMSQADLLAGYIDAGYQRFNIDKIYLDSYQQSATPSGNRYPDVNKAITQRIEKGTLIMNYTGHGGETGWAHEEVLQLSDINSWSNREKMPVFVTATCEFSRYDDPERTSAGEQVLLNPLGGGIALFTTSRPTFGTPNLSINKSFYKYAIPAPGTSRTRMGDIIRDAKRESGSDENGRKFVLLGDPALQIATPQLKVVTTQINNKPVGSDPDTLSALTKITITGIIADAANNKEAGFNGSLTVSVFDKPVQVTTLANDGGSPFTFSLQKNLLYKGHVEVKDGAFIFTFIVPRDISYRYGFGKISYYAQNGEQDASGSYENIVIGGDGENAEADNSGPVISLYMNDLYFINGGTTDENPALIGLVADKSGINTAGTGIGHDLVAVLDDNYDAPFVLNDYYESDVNTYENGRILFPFVGLPEGAHKVLVKAWDVYNNSSEATLDFMVVPSGNFIMENVMNFPNPFSEYTDIAYSHNQQGKLLATTVMIYSLSGKPVITLYQEGQDFGSRSLPVRWNGRSTSGIPAAAGIYIYKITSVTSDGLSATKSGKLIYTR
ncbi:MAG TPA: type IX secretion system sortase PorU [Bacteroidales bacterium]|nr:type IX secretion system sortase PorU [Bacteroidales bacterium]